MPSEVCLSPGPLMAPATIDAVSTSGAAATMLTMEFEDPTGYGRVARDADGDVLRVAETKAAGDLRRTLPSVERSQLA